MAWDFIGNAWAVDVLRRHLHAGKARHAYLFTGPAGVGKRTLALRLAQAVSCVAPPAPGEWCGECRACRHVPLGTHTDLHVLAREQDRTRIRVEQVRQLQKQLMLAPLESRVRVALLLDLEDANDEAQNALLKTLEEPTDRVVLLLTADRAELLLPTIVSRCEVLALRPVPTTALAAALVERGFPPDSAERWASLASGRPGEALRLAQEPERDQERRNQLEELVHLLQDGKAERFRWAAARFGRGQAETMQQRREQALEMLERWQGLWRDVLLASSGAAVPPIYLDLERTVAQMSTVLREEEAADAMLATRRAGEAIQRNVDPQLVFETLLLDLPSLRAVFQGDTAKA